MASIRHFERQHPGVRVRVKHRTCGAPVITFTFTWWCWPRELFCTFRRNRVRWWVFFLIPYLWARILWRAWRGKKTEGN